MHRDIPEPGVRRPHEFLVGSAATSRPPSISAMRVPRRSASRKSCVTKTTVFRALLQSEKFALQFRARDGIERAERLVHKKDRRVGGETTRDAHTSALTAGKFFRIARRESRIQTDQLQKFYNPRYLTRSAAQFSIAGTRPTLRSTVK